MLRFTRQVYRNLRSFKNYPNGCTCWFKISQPLYVTQDFLKGLSFKSLKHSFTPVQADKDTDILAKYFAWKFSPSLSSLHSKMDTSLLLPPATVRGMTSLDREAFVKKVVVPVVRINNEVVHTALKHVKKFFLKMDKLKPVQTDTDDPNKKLLLLNPVLVKSVDDIKIEFEAIAAEGDAEFLNKEITLCYENWKADDIIKSVLPENQEGAQGYSLIGHILHLNLRDHVLPYKTLIGEVLLEKIPNISLVVNKTNIIDTTYRNFEMEILAGTGKTDVTVRENGYSFSFDFAKVYWNPRLSTEHERIVKKLKHGDVLYDVMAGVGPFTIPAGRKKCRVLANDLNPFSYESLVRNCSSNKIKERVTCYNLDGHEFIKSVLKKDLLKTWRDSNFCGAVHITMNLPAMAVEFLPSFIGIFTKADNVPTVKVTSPLLHVYMFTKDAKDDTAISMVAEKLGYIKTEESDVDTRKEDDVSDINPVSHTDDTAKTPNDFGGLREYIDEIVSVRSVAPNKTMMRVSLKLPFEVLTNNYTHAQEPPTKKMKGS